MILVDSLHINIGGGKILLDYLVEELEKKKLNVFYLFDSRCENDYQYIPKDKKLYLKANAINRLIFYLKYANKYNTILCFGNIPPPIKCNKSIRIYTYFHQLLFIGKHRNKSLLTKLILYPKIAYIRFLKSNTTFWLVQSALVKNGLVNKFKISRNCILIIPFFKPIPPSIKKRERNSFAYIGMAPPHKNHALLIEAWNLLRTKNIKPILHLTVPDEYLEVKILINQSITNGTQIVNHGSITRQEVSDILYSSQYLIFPSLTESFGLPLVEGIDAGCKIISANLDYVHQVIEPSYTFDPHSINSIANAVIYSLTNDLSPSKKIVKNEIDSLISLL